MTAAVALPLWSLLCLMAATPLAGWLGARSGAKQAIALCSAHYGCSMQAEKQRASDTQDLERQLAELRTENPKLAAMRKATREALKETGERPAEK